jgi:hypothetical protein
MGKGENLKDFFDIPQEEWEKEWEGMPEFVQKDLSPQKSLIVHFSSYQDLEKFSQLIGQSITRKTRSIWFPKADIIKVCNKRYVDES